jgi:hypothetical protein
MGLGFVVWITILFYAEDIFDKYNYMVKQMYKNEWYPIIFCLISKLRDKIIFDSLNPAKAGWSKSSPGCGATPMRGDEIRGRGKTQYP